MELTRYFILILTLLFFTSASAQRDSLPPGSIGYYLSKAVEESRAKNYKLAISFVDSAMAKDSNNENIYSLRAEILLRDKRFIEAATDYQRALLLDRDQSYSFGAYVFLGVLYEKAKLRDKAQAQYQKSVYFFEHRRRRNDKLFEPYDRMDYVLALLLSGNQVPWDILDNGPLFREFREKYYGKSRENIIAAYLEVYEH
jgi:tetratricopeptide (TPR) repeat protein